MRYLASFAWAILLIASVPFVANGATTQVSSDLQGAIDAASSGDTLLVAPGAYEKITIGKSLKLIGNGAVIRAGDRDACVSVEADGVEISGFLVRDGFYGIKLDNVKGCKLDNNTVIRCVQPGIALLFSNGNTITGNNASFNGLGGEGWYGIYLSNSNDNLIDGNVASGNGAYGICLFPSCNNNTITRNVLQGNMYGLYMFRDCSRNHIESNVMSKNINSGLDLRINCTDNLILNNIMEKNAVAGITLMEMSGHNTIKENRIAGNKRYGLQIQSGSDGNIIINNSISDSQTGIFLESSGNVIYGNRITENAVSADDRGKNSWNAAYPEGGNLWSDYHGKDEMSGPGQDIPGKDGFVDEPYGINEISQDKYPIMGNQEKQILVIDKSVSPASARIGDSIAVMARIKSKYKISQASVNAFRLGSEAKGYARLIPTGDLYQGKFSTALLDPGSYEMVLRARDERGYELRETLGNIEVGSRSGGFSSSK